ncbi:hypothetical protein F5Y19DRAFT_134389 [Xylariaceae sp. FL1651]|nr:hypothetical protein F5Y19DRAFT_134389 [Xylariaceae sp. FL1651]
MDISFPQTPKTGRSRFSKALPTPPPGLNDRTMASRELPILPPAPLPPRKDSITVKSTSNMSLQSKGFNSPLPALPTMTEAPQLQVQTRSIPRKPVGQSITPPATSETTGAITKSNKMKRVSSISSLLSAYSHSSSDSAQRSSHESDFTKDSEPSYSPEREGMVGLQAPPAKTYVDLINDSYSDKASEVTSNTIINSFPPPPPLKDPSRPRTPSAARPLDAVRDRRESSSPTSLRSGSPQAGREIWRRRASSKSDRNLTIADLKLAGSNGSTASTSHTPAAKAELPLAPPPPKPNHQSATTLPPRNASLPGRNIRPIKPVELVDDDDEMKKLTKLLKRVGRDDGSKSDQQGDKLEALRQDSAQRDPRERKQPGAKGNTMATKPEPPTKDLPLPLSLPTYQHPTTTDTQTPAAEAGVQPVPPSELPAPPPKESGKSTVISRRPVGALPLNQPELKTKTSASDLAPTRPTNSHPPGNTIGTLPHPRQRASPANLQNGPTSPTGGQPGPTPTTTRSGQNTTKTETIQTPGRVTSPKDQPQVSMPVSRPVLTSNLPDGVLERPTHIGSTMSSNDNHLSPQEYVAPPRSTPAPLRSGPLTRQPAALSDVHEEETTSSGWGASALAYNGEHDDRDPPSAAAILALERFPRGDSARTWDIQCTAEGVWPPIALGDRHYGCFTGHAQLVPSRNMEYPLACQTCRVADNARRRICAFCSLRICLPCHDLLVANGRDLRATMALLKGQNKIAAWGPGA